MLSHPAPGATVVSEEMREWAVIHGRAENKLLTLLDASVRSARTFNLARMFDGGPDELELRAETLLVGCHLEGRGQPAFESAIVTAENLATWSRQTNLNQSMEFDDASGMRTTGITAVAVPPLIAELGDFTAKLHTLSWTPGFKYQRWGTTAEVRERATIEFEAAAPRPLLEWTRLMAMVEDLLSLSTLSACALIWMRVFLPATPDDDWPVGHPLHMRRHEVQVYQQRILKPRPDEEAITRDFVLTLDDLPFEKLMPKWMSIDAKFSAARSMILGLRYVTGGYLESKVVTAVAAAESMSRELNEPAPVMTRRQLRDLRTTVVEAAPEQWQPWVRERFANAEPTLKERLEVLAARPGEFMSLLVPNASAWATSAANARNKLAHAGSSSHTGHELYAVVEITSAVVIMNFLFELGVPADRMKTALAEHWRLKAAARLAQELFPADSR
ncbi:hypothetical protein JCM13591A_08180 [Microbacterium xylanilyticum]